MLEAVPGPSVSEDSWNTYKNIYRFGDKEGPESGINSVCKLLWHIASPAVLIALGLVIKMSALGPGWSICQLLSLVLWDDYNSIQQTTDRSLKSTMT